MSDQFYSYQITNAGGVTRYSAVVYDPTNYTTTVGVGAPTVKLPAAAHAGQFAGMAVEAQATQNDNVKIQKYGRVFFRVKGAVTYGDALEIADNTGALQSCQAGFIATAGGPTLVNKVAVSEGTYADGDIGVCTIEVCSKVTPT